MPVRQSGRARPAWTAAERTPLLPLFPPGRRNHASSPDANNHLPIGDWEPLVVDGKRVPAGTYAELTFVCLLRCWDASLEAIVPATVKRAVEFNPTFGWMAKEPSRFERLEEQAAGADLRLKVEVRENDRQEVEVRCVVVNLGSRYALVGSKGALVRITGSKRHPDGEDGLSFAPDDNRLPDSGGLLFLAPMPKYGLHPYVRYEVVVRDWTPLTMENGGNVATAAQVDQIEADVATGWWHSRREEMNSIWFKQTVYRLPDGKWLTTDR